MDTALQNEIARGNLRQVKWLLQYEKNDSTILEEALHSATEANQLSIVQYLLTQNPSLDVDCKSCDNNNITPLMKACLLGNESIVQVLLQHGASIHMESTVDSMTPLQYAAQGRHFDILPLLVDHGARVDSMTDRGNNLLHSSVQSENIPSTTFLLDKAAQEGVSLVNQINDEGQTPLHAAVEVRNLELVKLLVDVGGDPTIVDLYGLSPLALAVHTGEEGICAHLLERGAVDGNSCENLGSTLLHIAVASGNPAIVDLLIEYGAQVDSVAQRGFVVFTPLHLSCEHGNLPMVQRLVEKHGADIEAATEEGRRSLHVAVRSCNLQVAAYLIDRGADVNAVGDRQGRTSLHLAVELRQEDLVSLLLIRGANVNAQDLHGETPLHTAANFRCMAGLNIMMLLLENGANPNAMMKYNNKRPLHLAGSLEARRALLAKGAEVDAVTTNGLTALHVSAASRYTESAESVKLLLHYGAAIERQSDLGYTPLHMAAEEGNEGAMNSLLDAGAHVDAQSIYKFTPLHLAARAKHYHCSFLLLREGRANIALGDCRGRTALHVAAERGMASLVEELLNRGADCFRKDGDGMTPIEAAATPGHVDATAILLRWALMQ